MVMSNNCGNCRFSLIDGKEYRCRRFPPTQYRYRPRPEFPAVFEGDWCGEWSPREEEDEYDRMSEEDKEFLAQAHQTRYLQRQTVDAALDRIHALADEAMAAGRFGILDKFLKELPIAATPTDCLLGWLTATLPAKSNLPSRAGLVGVVRLELEARGSAGNERVAVVEKLLEGLE